MSQPFLLNLLQAMNLLHPDSRGQLAAAPSGLLWDVKPVAMTVLQGRLQLGPRTSEHAGGTLWALCVARASMQLGIRTPKDTGSNHLGTASLVFLDSL